MKIEAIILAAGSGSRFESQTPKQFIKIAGKSALQICLETFSKSNTIKGIVVVSNADFLEETQNIVNLIKSDYKIKVTVGGRQRQDSTLNGLAMLDEDTSHVMIHDSVRPLISQEIINNVASALIKEDVVDVVNLCSDTMLQVDESKKYIKNFLDRNFVFKGQTPQSFKVSVLKEAYKLFLNDKSNKKFTDDCSIVAHYLNKKIYCVDGNEQNMKITYPIDIHILDKIFQTNSMQLCNENEDLSFLKDKHILIFGHSSGIGKSVFDIAKEHGAIIEGYSLEDNFDVTNNEDVISAAENFISKHSYIDYFINTTGILKIADLENLSEETILKMISINYSSVVMVTKIMLDKVKGMILHFASSSYTRGRGGYSIYSSCKAAVVNFVQAVSEEINTDLKINVIVPARTDTPMRFSNFGKEEENTLLTSEYVALKTLLTLKQPFSGQVVDIKKID